MTQHSADSELRTKGSLCSGAGGLDAAVPGELRYVAESNPEAATILKMDHPDVTNLGDITKVHWSERDHHVDVLLSGDPCQSLSAAGRQLASDDSRFLWPYVIDTIRRTRPREIFLENVQNVVSVALVKDAEDWRGERGSVLRMRLDDLRAAGYAARWTVLGACAVGAPHHRHRWFLRARYVGSDAPVAERVINKCGAPRNGPRVLLPTPAATRGGYNQGGAAGRVGPKRYGLDMIQQLLPTPAARDHKGKLDGKRDGGPNLNNVVALLPTPTTADGSGGPGSSGRDGGLNLRTAVTLLPTPRATDGVNGGPSQRGRKGDLAMGSAVQEAHWGKFAEAVALWEAVTGNPVPPPTVPAPKGGQRLNPALSEWMMGYAPGHVTDRLARNDALRVIGNGVVTLQAATAWEQLA